MTDYLDDDDVPFGILRMLETLRNQRKFNNDELMRMSDTEKLRVAKEYYASLTSYMKARWNIPEWRVEWNGRGNTRMGYMASTTIQNKVVVAMIRYNGEKLKQHPYELIYNTIPHELAHALEVHLTSQRSSHGNLWRQLCLHLGGNGQRCANLRQGQQHQPQARRPRPIQPRFNMVEVFNRAETLLQHLHQH